MASYSQFSSRNCSSSGCLTNGRCACNTNERYPLCIISGSIFFEQSCKLYMYTESRSSRLGLRPRSPRSKPKWILLKDSRRFGTGLEQYCMGYFETVLRSTVVSIFLVSTLSFEVAVKGSSIFPSGRENLMLKVPSDLRPTSLSPSFKSASGSVRP